MEPLHTPPRARVRARIPHRASSLSPAPQPLQPLEAVSCCCSVPGGLPGTGVHVKNVVILAWSCLATSWAPPPLEVGGGREVSTSLSGLGAKCGSQSKTGVFHYLRTQAIL
eukprot:353401-Chlamydomonas_euryale.AAC.2